MTVLSIDGLRKEFRMHVLDDTRVVGLDDLSFDVRDGEFLAVVGESGSGKSSLLKCLYGTYDPTRGSILFDGPGRAEPVDLGSCPDRTILELREESIGYTSQFLEEIPRVPAVDVVARPLVERGHPVETARERAEELLTRLHVPETLFDAYPATFSGGERQRVNLAQAVAPKPDLLLLDEPTSALDPETRDAAIDLLDSFLPSSTTVIGVFHNAAVVQQLADRVLVLDDGQLDQILAVEDYQPEVDQ